MMAPLLRVVLFAAAGALLTSTVVAAAMTATTDPGVMVSPDLVVESTTVVNPLATARTSEASSAAGTDEARSSAVSAATAGPGGTLHRCPYCHAMRAPEMHAHHSRLTDFCILGFDHSCFVLNQDIGVRNRRWFFLALLSAASYSVVLVLPCVYRLIAALAPASWNMEQQADWGAPGSFARVGDIIACSLVLTVILLASWLPFRLLHQQVWLIAAGLTACEAERAHRRRCLPDTRAACSANCHAFWCRPRPPSALTGPVISAYLALSKPRPSDWAPPTLSRAYTPTPATPGLDADTGDLPFEDPVVTGALPPPSTTEWGRQPTGWGDGTAAAAADADGNDIA